MICNLSGMSTLEQVRDNIHSVQELEPLTEAEKAQLKEVVRLYKDAGPIGADLEQYRGLKLHGAPSPAFWRPTTCVSSSPTPASPTTTTI